MKLYRFRSDPEFTLDELEKNYFYFSLPNELNDPMEGFINLYWEGDKILWKNFLKHYLLFINKYNYKYLYIARSYKQSSSNSF